MTMLQHDYILYQFSLAFNTNEELIKRTKKENSNISKQNKKDRRSKEVTR